MKAIELAVFKLKSDVEGAAFAAALAETDSWLASQPGFLIRRHGIGDDHERLDYIEWETSECAMAAGALFVSAPETQAYMSTIDPASISMRHYELRS